MPDLIAVKTTGENEKLAPGLFFMTLKYKE